MTTCALCGIDVEEHLVIRGNGMPPRSYWTHVGPDEQAFYIDRANFDHDAWPATDSDGGDDAE